MHLKICLPALALITLSANVARAEDDLCDYPQCKLTKYLAIWDSAPPAANCRTGTSTCELRAFPPPDVFLECHYNYGAYDCEAWPQGPELTFEWNSSGFVSDPLPATGPVSGVSCLGIDGRGGFVSVTVTGPGGSRLAFESVSCRQQIEP